MYLLVLLLVVFRFVLEEIMKLGSREGMGKGVYQAVNTGKITDLILRKPPTPPPPQGFPESFLKFLKFETPVSKQVLHEAWEFPGCGRHCHF